jgi:hypothetical protein
MPSRTELQTTPFASRFYFPMLWAPGSTVSACVR